MQLINDTEERNLEILERTSEILRRSMVNSYEEVKKLLSGLCQYDHCYEYRRQFRICIFCKI